MKLSEVNIGEKAVIVKVAGYGGFRRRIVEMGFIKGKVVEVLHIAPLGDPIEYLVMGYHVSLRHSEADKIEVISLSEAEKIAKQRKSDSYLGTISEDEIRQVALDRRKHIQVALVGNPNAGKTSLFNILSGQHQKVGNYSGVTIAAKEGFLDYKGYHIKVVDLPGTYSLSAYSPEERYVRSQIVDERPDVVINVVDAGNLERNLFLTTQLIDMNVRMVIALNMYDELESRGDKFDYELLSAMIGIPMIPTVAPRLVGINELFDNVIKIYEGGDYIDSEGNIIASADEDDLLDKHYHELDLPHRHVSKSKAKISNLNATGVKHRIRHIHINYGPIIESSITKIKDSFLSLNGIGDDYTPRYMAIKLLEHDEEMEHYILNFDNGKSVIEVRDICNDDIHSEMKDSSENIIQDAKYGFISGALKETYIPYDRKKGKTKTQLVDNVVTSRFLGYPIFLLAIFIMFQSTFVLGSYPMEWIAIVVDLFASWLNSIMSPGILRDLIVDGIIQGVGGVLVFLPNILILYFFITLMESSGYMARAAFIMDKIMHKIGLHGRSFIPLIMGFGCNVPAIMATRTIENKNARMVTILISPLMSCSARLPIYLLFIGTFFTKHAGVVLFSIYIVGVMLAALMAIIFKRFMFSKEEVPFVMELPPYRMPSVKMMLRDTWEKGEQYLKKIGTTILIGSIVIWALSYFPMYKGLDTDNMTREQQYEQKANSYLGQIGRTIQPVLAPLGFDWKTSVALLTGVTAKEVVISTIGILYNADDEDPISLSQRLSTEVDESGNLVFTPAVVLSLMLFVLIYFPCIGTIATIQHETKSWLWALFVVIYTVVLAWLVSFITYQSIINNVWQEVVVFIILSVSIIVVVSKIINSIKNRKQIDNCSSSNTCVTSTCSGCPKRRRY